MNLGIDTVEVFQPTDQGNIRADKFNRSMFDKEKGTVNYDDGVMDEALEKQSYFAKTRRYNVHGNVLVVHIHSLSRLAGKGFVGNAGYDDLVNALGDIGSKYLKVDGGNWIVSRLDVKCDVRGDLEFISDYQTELRDYFTMPNWRKVCYATPKDIRAGHSQTVYFVVKNGQLEAYNKGVQIREVYRDCGFDDDYLRLENKHLGSKAVRNMGIRDVSDLKYIDFAKVILDRYKKLKLVEGGVKAGGLVEMIVGEYWRQTGNKRVRINLDRLLLFLFLFNASDDLLQIDRTWLVNALCVKGLPYNTAYKLGRRLEYVQMGYLQTVDNRVEKKPVLVNQVGEMLELASSGVACKPTAPAPQRFGLNDDPSLPRGRDG